MADKLMYIPNDDAKIYFNRLQLVVGTFGHLLKLTNHQTSIKVPKFVNE